MDTLNIHELSLLLDQDIVVLPEEIRKHQLSETLKARHASHPEENPETGPHGPIKPEEEYYKIDYEGNFEKGVLIIYEGKDLEAENRGFLMKILGAVGCSLKDVALVSATHLQEYPPESFSQLNPHTCLVFGSVSHPLIPPKKVNYEIISGEIVFLFADDLKDIAENTPLKKNLWTSLQVLFHINK